MHNGVINGISSVSFKFIDYADQSVSIVDINSLETLVDFLGFNFGYSMDYISDSYIPWALIEIIFQRTGCQINLANILHIKNEKQLPIGNRYMILFDNPEEFALCKMHYV